MPYRGKQEPLILDGLGIACLSGPNGAGKSALLDAITWALWGRSRAGTGADPLVAAGMAEMGVELEFRAQDIVYRVERRYRRGRVGRGQATFDFQIRDGDRWRSLNEANSTQTGRQLASVIRLDYETFINTSFLLQGRADLFVSQRPAERKRILGEILSLSLYDRLSRRARDMAREDRTRQEVARGRIADIDTELAVEDDLRGQSESVEAGLRESREKLAAAVIERDRLSAVHAEMQSRQRDAEALRERISALENEVAALTSRRDELQQAVGDAEAVLARSAEIEAGWEELQRARSEVSDYGVRARVHGELVAERGRLERQDAERRALLEGDVKLRESSHADIAREAAQLTALQDKLSRAEAARAGLATRQQALAARREERDRLFGEIEGRRERHRALTTENAELTPRMALVTDNTHAECPVCGTELGQHGMARVREHFQQRRNEISILLRRIAAENKDLRGQHAQLDESIMRDEGALRAEQDRAASEAGAIRAQVERAERAGQELPGAAARLEQTRARLAAQPQESDEMRAIRARLAELDYDTDTHERAQLREDDLRHWDEARRELETVAARVDRDKASLTDTLEQWTDRTDTLERERARRTELEAGLAGMAETAVRAEEARAVVDAVGAEVRDAEQDQVRLATLLQRLAERRAERERLLQEEREADQRGSIHDELGRAFGPQGVQALLIETALPELEDDANELLARMTNGSMTLRLETQRTTQAGTQQETLEVIIADGSATRAYEMYSGGEAFRINFALRIALSKLLARRAGAEVPVLFIDEGFGSQDAEGRERLIEAISTLWGDAAFHNGLILVITHIDDVRSRFETRVDVVKTEDGSRYSLAP